MHQNFDNNCFLTAASVECRHFSSSPNTCMHYIIYYLHGYFFIQNGAWHSPKSAVFRHAWRKCVKTRKLPPTPIIAQERVHSEIQRAKLGSTEAARGLEWKPYRHWRRDRFKTILGFTGAVIREACTSCHCSSYMYQQLVADLRVSYSKVIMYGTVYTYDTFINHYGMSRDNFFNTSPALVLSLHFDFTG